MSIQIPAWVIVMATPWILAALYSLRFDNTKHGGGGWWPASSDRDGYWFFAFPACVVASSVFAAVYWAGVAKGWWP